MFLKRLTALILCLCLMPAWVLADENHDMPVTRSVLETGFHLYPDAFPNDGAAHYQDWADFLAKFSLRGTADSQLFMEHLERLYFDGGLYLNDQLAIPFEYDNYYNVFRYLRSPALDGASIHFQFRNFFQFCLKPYYYMGLPGNLVGVALYPQAAVGFVDKYEGPLGRVFAGEGSREVSYDELYALCEELDLIINEDAYEATYYFLTCLLIDTGLDAVLLDKLSYLEGWLDYLDPDGEGMSITVEDGSESWVLGETTVLEKTVSDGETVLNVCLPDEEGYEFVLEYRETEDARSALAQVLFEGSEYLGVNLRIDGLNDPLSREGTITAEITGDAIYEPIPAQTFLYRLEKSAETAPYHMTLEFDWVHPETQKPAFGLHYQADVEELPRETLCDRPYDNQDDFFQLNEGLMSEYKERFLPKLVMAAIPIALEMPAGVISDAVAWLDETGFLAFFGLE